MAIKKPKIKKLIQRTRNWLDGAPAASNSRTSNYQMGFFSSSISMQHLSELSIIAESSSCSHRQEDDHGVGETESRLQPVKNSSLLHNPRQISLQNENESFMSNEVHSTKYNLFTFIPKNLFEQFHRVANIYFLLLVVLQFIPPISSYNPMLSAAPLLIILIATGIKDGIEDLRRHQADKRINESHAILLEKTVDEGSFSKKLIKWKEIKVGDFLYLKSGDAIPADAVIISASATEVYVDTASLDGETNLKVKRVPPLQPTDGLSLVNSKIIVEQPCSNLHSFSGELCCYQYDEIQRLLITVENLLLRGCILKNTDWVIAIVLYTGHDTKILLNSLTSASKQNSNIEMAPSKRSTIERQLNRQILLNFLLLFILCLVCMCVESFYSTSTKLLIDTTTFASVIISFFSSLILFQTIIPISLYITVEICKTVHAFLIHADIEMAERNHTNTQGDGVFGTEGVGKDSLSPKGSSPTLQEVISEPFFNNGELGSEPCTVNEQPVNTHTHCIARAWNLSDDLGRVQFIFSDKTGTLTQNIMKFKFIYIADQVFSLSENSVPDFSDEKFAYFWRHSFLLLALCHSAIPCQGKQHLYSPRYSKSSDISSNSMLEKVILFPTSPSAKNSNFDIDADISEDGGHDYAFTGESPDEIALLSACVHFGFIYRGSSFANGVKSAHILTRKIKSNHSPGDVFDSQVDKFQILMTIPFTSERQRMSVIVKSNDGSIFVYCKGSDTAILTRSKDGSSTQPLESRINEWALQGLRILCLGMKEIDFLEWSKLSTEYSRLISSTEVENDCHNSYQSVEEIFEVIENDLLVLGATAIEDALQDGVPETVKSFREARISTWVLTGDKAETALNVATSAGLITCGMKVIPLLSNQGQINLSTSSSNSQTCVFSQCALKASLLRIIHQLFGEQENALTGIEIPLCEHLTPEKEPTCETSPITTFFSPTTTYFSVIKSPFSVFSELFGSPSPQQWALGLNPSIKSSLLAVQSHGSVLIVDGPSLKYVLDQTLGSDALKILFLSVALRCTAVICCRVAPLQKANIVGLIKEFLPTAVTLSIGDGANDVSMLRKADIGIGISTGKEGCQAVMAADYSVTQFKHLQRLLLVHGRWSYHRTSAATLCCFYKNIAFVFVLFWYQFDCAFSSQFIYDYVFLLFYNFLFSVFPVLSVGIFDRDVEATVAMKIPSLYTGGNDINNQKGNFSKGAFFHPIFKPVSYYSIGGFALCMLEGIYQSLICYLIPRFIYLNNPMNTLLIYSNFSKFAWIPIPEDRTVVGTVMAFSVIISVNITILLYHRSWTLITLGSVGSSLLILVIMFLIMSSWSITSTLYGTPWILFFQPAFYYTLLCCITLSIFPRIIIQSMFKLIRPSSLDILNDVLAMKESDTSLL